MSHVQADKKAIGFVAPVSLTSTDVRMSCRPTTFYTARCSQANVADGATTGTSESRSRDVGQGQRKVTEVTHNRLF